MAISKVESFELYKTMYLIRRSEEMIQTLYHENEMKTPMHMSVGEEAIVAGVVHALDKEDQVLGTYRSHALYLAKTRDTDGFFMEMYGKGMGDMKGKAGSMHLSSPKDGLLGTSAIVATTIPVAVGVALANVYKDNHKKVAVFFGDGATDEGSFWESFNFACLKKLPIFFICEDNDLAIHSIKKDRRGYKYSLSEVLETYDCYTYNNNTSDCEEIYQQTKSLSNQRSWEIKPVFMELSYYRYLEHVGVNPDFTAGYRQDESKLHNDPVKLQRERLLKITSEEKVKKMEDEVNLQIERSVKLAKEAPFAGKEELFTNVYA